jgi:hypothetical protein
LPCNVDTQNKQKTLSILIVEAIPPNGKESIVTKYNQIIQKVNIEREKSGIQKGIEIKIEFVLKSYQQGLSADFKTKITALDAEEGKKTLKQHTEKH